MGLAQDNGGWLNLLIESGGIPCELPYVVEDQIETDDECWYAVSAGRASSEFAKLYVAATATSAPILGEAQAIAGEAAEEPNPIILELYGLKGCLQSGCNEPSSQPSATEATSSSTCRNDTELLQEANISMVVGELHTYADTTAFFKYGKTGDSAFGVGFRQQGGAWTVESQASVGNTRPGTATTWNVGPARFGKHLTSQFHWLKQRHWRCDLMGSRYFDTISPKQKMAWIGGAGNGADVSEWDGWDQYSSWKATCSTCWVAYLKNTEEERSGGKAYTYSAQISAFGVGLWARSGYSDRARLYWKFGTARTKYILFGHDGTPKTATIVYAS